MDVRLSGQAQKLLADLATTPDKFDTSSLRVIEDANRAFRERFRMPEMQEFYKFHEQIEASLAGFRHLGLFASDVQSAMGAIASPWVDRLQVEQSFEGFAQLVGLGRAIRSNPFEISTKEAIRDALGDWEDLSEAALENSIQREKYYLDHGLAANLILAPEPAFTQSLQAARIFVPRLPTPRRVEEVDFELDAADLGPEEEALFARAQRAFFLLGKFERSLRNYLHKVMTERYGINWEKAKAPEGGRKSQRWMEKRDIAVKKGQAAIDLIHYADFTDYRLLVTRRDNWKDIFTAVFRDEEELRVSFRRIETIRVITMHGRPITKGDLLLLTAETSHILTAIGALRRI